MSNEGWIEVFRAGDYGPKGTYTEADLDGIVQQYNTELHRAPITVDHKQEGPAYGWVEAIKREGSKLLARVSDVAAELKEAFREKRYRTVSIELYPAGKIQGSEKQFSFPYFKALSVLGAAIPHVKGLAEVSFSDNAEYIQLAFDEGETKGMSKEAPDTKTETKAEESKAPKAPEVDAKKFAELQEEVTRFSEQVDTLKADLDKATSERDAAQTELATATDKLKKFAERESKLEQRVDALEAERAEQRFEAIFAENLKAGRVTPGEKDLLREQFDEAVAADKVNPKTVKFGEGDAAKTYESREAVFAASLSQRAQSIPFGESAGSEGPDRGEPKASDELVVERVNQYREEQEKAGRVLTYSEGYNALLAKGDRIILDAEKAATKEPGA